MLTHYRSVLVIEDDPIQQELYRTFFAKYSVPNVLTAHTGLEAIDILETRAPIELILLDLNMPERDGIELIEEFARRQLQVPIIIASGTIDPVFRAATVFAEAKQLNLVGALPKPIRFDSLLELMAHSAGGESS